MKTVEEALDELEWAIAATAAAGHIAAWFAQKQEKPGVLVGAIDVKTDELIRAVEHRWGVNISDHMKQGCADCRRCIDEAKAREGG